MLFELLQEKYYNILQSDVGQATDMLLTNIPILSKSTGGALKWKYCHF